MTSSRNAPREAVNVPHAFHKKTQAAPRKDLEIAKGRFRQLFGRKVMSKPEGYASVWDAMADTPRRLRI